jgi:hypothetical protein
MFLVTIHDKELQGEPDVALGIVEALCEEEAIRQADPALERYMSVGRCRCVAQARRIDIGRFYKLSAVVRTVPHG